MQKMIVLIENIPIKIHYVNNKKKKFGYMTPLGPLKKGGH